MPQYDLSQFIDNPEDKSTEEQIEELRALARTCREENNQLVQRIRDINQSLERTGNNKDLLQSELAKLQKKLADEDYPATFKTLTTLIHDLEVQKNGYSDVGGSSPYTL